MLDNSLSAYFASVRALRSADPSTRRPAISTLLELARRPKGPVQASAERALTGEFGPYAVTDGLSGCSGPTEAVLACCADGRECRSCAWFWPDRAEAFAGVGPIFGPAAAAASDRAAASMRTRHQSRADVGHI
ncbi:MAG TPA: hypothetical protein VFW75_16355 [Acetobacteraceae bacterium]|nr:hypothetical protein [Acetobacteraceae bacterium]